MSLPELLERHLKNMEKEIEDLKSKLSEAELRFQAARNLLVLEYDSEYAWTETKTDQEISAELKRLKGEK